LPWAGFHTLDGRWWSESKNAAIAGRRINDVPLIIGWNSFDGSSLRFPAERVLAETPKDVLATYPGVGISDRELAYSVYTDRHNGAPARWMAAQTSDGAPTYLYQFSYVLSAARASSRGAEHGREIFHVFDNWDKIPKKELPPEIPSLEAILTDQDREMTRLLHDCWISFARNGKPECEGAPAWPRYRPDQDQLMDFGETVEVRRYFRKAQLDAQVGSMDDTIATRRHAALELIDRLEREGGDSWTKPFKTD
jgi:para-nitrobenzyl esterase